MLQETLKALWSPLQFLRVTRVIAKPEDVLSIYYYPRGSNKGEHPVHIRPESKEGQEFIRNPALKTGEVDVAYHHYFGFTKNPKGDSIYFQRDTYCEIDLDIRITGWFSKLGNHTGGWTLPKKGDLVCALVTDAPKGPAAKHWFVSSPEFHLLWILVTQGRNHPSLTKFSNQELLEELISNKPLWRSLQGEKNNHKRPRCETSGRSWCSIYPEVGRRVCGLEGTLDTNGIPQGHKGSFEKSLQENLLLPQATPPTPQ